MLVIVSDLHLSDGASTSLLEPTLFEWFADRLADLALRASFRTAGRYQPVDRIDLILLGDTLDFTVSRRWLMSEVRPWSDQSRPGFSDTLFAIADDILRANAPALRILRALATEGAIRLPPANRNGQPLFQAERVGVPVAIHYMVGNHDWMLRLSGPNMDLLRQRVAHQMGLSNQHNIPFPHDPMESELISGILRKHRVVARHGDVFDPLAFADDRDASSADDALQIELLARFLDEVVTRYAPSLPDGVLSEITELTWVRPIFMAPMFLDRALSRGVSIGARREIKGIWDYLVEAAVEAPTIRNGRKIGSRTMAETIIQSLQFQRQSATSVREAMHSSMELAKGISPARSSYATFAAREEDFRNRRACHIVYGHTHKGDMQPLEVSHADGFSLSQAYFNAGTWRRVISPTSLEIGEIDYVSTDKFQLLTFFQNDECGQRPFECTSTTIGRVRPTMAPIGNESGMIAGSRRETTRPPHFVRPATTHQFASTLKE